MSELTWDASYAIALALKAQYPNIDLDQVSLARINEWTLALPDFSDDPELVNDDILFSIYQDWYEEVNPI